MGGGVRRPGRKGGPRRDETTTAGKLASFCYLLVDLIWAWEEGLRVKGWRKGSSARTRARAEKGSKAEISDSPVVGVIWDSKAAQPDLPSEPPVRSTETHLPSSLYPVPRFLSQMSLASPTPNLKILLIGNSSVGKSSLLLRFTDDDYLPEDQTTSTIGVDLCVAAAVPALTGVTDVREADEMGLALCTVARSRWLRWTARSTSSASGCVAPPP